MVYSSCTDVAYIIVYSYEYSTFCLHMELILWTSMDLLKYGTHKGSRITVPEECFSKILNMEEVESVHVIWKKCSTGFSETLLVESFKWSVHKLQPWQGWLEEDDVVPLLVNMHMDRR